jgi:outer membrane protein OmpA-like peptidoglycan-associated protein
MQTRVLKSVGRVLAFAILALLPVALAAQTASSAKGSSNQSPSRWDFFAGYSYLAPTGTVTTMTGTSTVLAGTGIDTVDPEVPGTGTPVTASYSAVNEGGLLSGAYYFNRFTGVQGEIGAHQWGTKASGPQGNGDRFTTFAGGLIFRYPMENITPFVHALVNADVVGGPYYETNTWGPGLTVGGGMDYETPWLNHHLAIRVFQADYEYMHVDFGPIPYGGRANINAARLSGGFVIHAGSIAPPPPVTLACSASPESIYPGDPVTVTATAGGLNPKYNVIYGWSGTGVTGNGTTATVATGSLAAGQYTIQATVKEGKPSQEGLKPWETATCTAGFTVKAFEPPTINCSADPSTINPGDKSTITAVGMSPQNRPLTYSYSATAGSISGAGTTATFDSTGAEPGAVTVTCNDSDDKGQSATANTLVTIAAPPPPPGPPPEQVRLEARLSLHSVFFPTDLPRAEHPEGGLVASQQGTLSTLATDFKNYLAFKPDAHLILTGHTDVRASVEYNQSLSERRVNRAKQFLVAQGVPEASIETRAVGKEQELSTDQVKDLVNQNTELSDTDKAKTLKQIRVIVLAQNRRVDITLSTTGQQSVQLYPFNAVDAMTLLSEKAPAHEKKAAQKKAK